MELRFGKYALRPFRKGDEPSLAENISDKKIARYTLHIAYPYTAENAALWVDYNRMLARKKDKKQLHLALDLDGLVIGGLGLANINGHRAELCYWLGVKYWGGGIMTAAVRSLTKYALEELALRRVYAQVVPANKASSRVLEKAGYKYEGRLRKHEMKLGKPVDLLLYAKVR
ncbi:MAG TPA: GNAT family protein [Elusimicrobiales bacterium]|mgnify:CR=1 FL=1|nr:GNAT family protein [Elusimicrobiales bacterium]